MRSLAFIVIALSVGVSQGASAQEILKKEPPAHAIKAGQYVYVDDGKCPKGQIMKVGAAVDVGSNIRGSMHKSERTHACVPHP